MMRQSSAPRACAALLAGLVLMLAAPGRVDAGQCQSSCGQAQPQPGLRIGGSAEGFAGELVLGLNAGFDTLVLAQPGAFRFARRVPQGPSGAASAASPCGTGSAAMWPPLQRTCTSATSPSASPWPALTVQCRPVGCRSTRTW